MKKIIIIYLCIFVNTAIAQSYDRIWGNVATSIFEEYGLACSDLTSERIYFNYINDHYGRIYYLEAPLSIPKLLYNFNTLLHFESFSLDNNGNLIVFGRTHNDKLGTLNAQYIKPFPEVFFTGHTFIAKIDKLGNLQWLTYFHDASQDKKSLTIDNNDNIYVLTKQNK